MNALVRWTAAAVLSVCGLVGGASHASALDLNGYVCDVTIYKYERMGTGKYGYIDVSVYSQPHCGGQRLGTHYYCSTGATWDYCGADKQFYLTESELLSLRSELIEAGRAGNYVSSYGQACKGGNTDACGATWRIFLYPTQ